MKFSEATPDARLSDRSKFFEVGIEVRYLDFAHGIDRRLSLGVQALNCDGADGDAGERRQCHCAPDQYG